MAEPTDTIVFDIETSNFFTSPDVDGATLLQSIFRWWVCTRIERDAYYCAEAGEQDILEEWFAGAKRTVGFASNRYDTPVLNLLFKKWGRRAGGALDLWRKDRVDLLEEIELATSRRVSLTFGRAQLR